jgi:hypothetical protein
MDSEEVAKRSVEGSSAVGQAKIKEKREKEKEAGARGRGTSSGTRAAQAVSDSLESGGGYVFVVSLFVQFQIPKKRENYNKDALWDDVCCVQLSCGVLLTCPVRKNNYYIVASAK